MSEVFVSYARPDEPLAKRIADALRSNGYCVWRDDELPAHRAYADVIEERLRSAGAVVVLWSADAVKSQWVRSEANVARSAERLVQATLDGVMPPLPFDQIQCADLRDWQEQGLTAGWRKLLASVADLAGPGDDKGVPSPQQSTGKLAVCVLPFKNMSGDMEQEYFSDGISEDITTDLSKISALEVTARNTAFQFKGRSIDVTEVARKLAVTHVLEGSVRKAGNRVRITAQLIDGKGGGHIWAERYDRDLTDIFAIQDEISKAIVDALKLRLLPEERKAIEQRGTSSADAYNLYLMAHNYWVMGNWGDVRQAELVVRICSRAVEIDPDYARALGLLAVAQAILYFLHSAGGDGGLGAAERALGLDPKLAEAHIVRARHLFEQSKLDEANEALRLAVEFGPLSWIVNHEAGMLSYFQRNFEDAAVYFEKAASIAETDFHSWGMLTSIYESLGDKESETRAAHMAVANAERILAHNPTNGAALAMGATGLGLLGEHDRFRDWADRALLIDPDNMIMAYNFACILTRLGEFEEAIDLIEARLKNITPALFRGVLRDADIDPLRELPRFQKMIDDTAKRLGIAA